MKKQLAILCGVLGLVGCSNTEDSTLLNFFSWDEEEVISDAPADNLPSSGYYLAKRSDRYATADYVLEPRDYSIVATRATNKMLADAPGIFAADKQAPLYIADMVQIDRYLPDGSYAAEQTAKNILYGSGMFNIVDDKSSAAYILQSSISNINTPEVPVIIYRLELYDNLGKSLGRWSDTIRQVQNDDGSWW